MPARKKPTYLKRQKEQARVARAIGKREARRARKHSKTSQPAMDDSDLEGMPDTEAVQGQEDNAEGESNA